MQLGTGAQPNVTSKVKNLESAGYEGGSLGGRVGVWYVYEWAAREDMGYRSLARRFLIFHTINIYSHTQRLKIRVKSGCKVTLCHFSLKAISVYCIGQFPAPPFPSDAADVVIGNTRTSHFARVNH